MFTLRGRCHSAHTLKCVSLYDTFFLVKQTLLKQHSLQVKSHCSKLDLNGFKNGFNISYKPKMIRKRGEYNRMLFILQVGTEGVEKQIPKLKTVLTRQNECKD